MTTEGDRRHYRRDVLALMSGSAIAQALPIAAAPILTRIYSPDDFGVAALFLAVATVMASVVNGRYELAIGLPESDDDAINIAALGVAIAVFASVLFLLLIAFFGTKIAILADTQEVIPWLCLIPLSVLLTGIFNVLNYTNNRLGKFKEIAKANVFKSVAGTATMISLGFIVKGALGLIIGGLVSQFVSNMRLYHNIRAHFDLNQISYKKAVRLAKRYKDFPRYSMWSGVFNTAANNSIIFFMPIVFGIGALGSYNLATRVLSAPSALISSAMGQVFLREATRERQLHGHAKRAFKKTVRNLTLIGVPIFGAVFLFAEPLFALVFGDSWRVAGVYAIALVPLLLTRFIVSTVSMMNVVFEKNYIGFYWQVILAVLSLGLIGIAYHQEWSLIQYLWVNSIILSAHYLSLLLIMARYNR